MRLASCVLAEEVAFWWEAIQRTNFIGRWFDAITSVEFMDLSTIHTEQVCEWKGIESFMNLKQDNHRKVREY